LVNQARSALRGRLIHVLKAKGLKGCRGAEAMGWTSPDVVEERSFLGDDTESEDDSLTRGDDESTFDSASYTSSRAEEEAKAARKAEKQRLREERERAEAAAAAQFKANAESKAAAAAAEAAAVAEAAAAEAAEAARRRATEDARLLAEAKALAASQSDRAARKAIAPLRPPPAFRLTSKLRDLGPIHCLALGPRAADAADTTDAADGDEGFGDAVVVGRADESITVWDLAGGARQTSYVNSFIPAFRKGTAVD